MSNPTDYYDPALLEEVRKILNRAGVPGGKPETEQDPHEAVISFADAISIAEGGSPQYDDLSIQQKFLIAQIAQWREDPEGVKETDRLAHEGHWIGVDLNTRASGRYHPDIRLVTVNPLRNINESALQGTLEHEYRHASYHLDSIGKNPNEGLSSFDVGLACLGEEGNAAVFEEVRRRQKLNLPPATKEEKRDLFMSYATGAGPYSNYDMYSRTRNDGRKFDAGEFAKRFGNIPGEEENFLDGLQDVDDAFLAPREKDKDYYVISDSSKGAFISAYRAAIQEPVTYENLPPLKAGERRLEGKDDEYKAYVAYLKPGQDGSPPTMDLYVRRYNDENGTGRYVKIFSDLKGQPANSGNIYYYGSSYDAAGNRYEPLNLTLRTDGKIETWGRAWSVDEQGRYSIQPYIYHETTPSAEAPVQAPQSKPVPEVKPPVPVLGMF